MRFAALTLLALVALGSAAPAVAQTQPKSPKSADVNAMSQGMTQGMSDQAGQQRKYLACMAEAQATPKEALRTAIEWEKQGGGDAARHCVADSYMSLGQYDDAALELERIAETMPQIKAPIMAQLFGQAAQAWLQLNKMDRALIDLNKGLKLDKQNVDLLVFRAQIYGIEQKYFDALDDLNAAYDLTSDRGAILVLRARAYRELKQPDLAKDNVDLALKADPGDPDALLERGIQRAQAGDRDGARADFMQAIEIDPNSPEAEEARKSLADIDVKVN